MPTQGTTAPRTGAATTSTGRGAGGRMPMMGAPGGGRGQGGEDEQHERKYVQLEPVVTAEDDDGRIRDADGNPSTPPVIGR